MQDVYFFNGMGKGLNKTKEKGMNNMKRYRLLDNLRGITLLSMIAYHALWDLVYIYDRKVEWYSSAIGHLWQQSICWTFILLSGFCWCLGKKKIKRGLTVFGGGLVITAVTLLVIPENRVVFGVLTLLGSCMLIQIVLEPLWKRCNSLVGMLLAFFLFLLLKNINGGYLGIATWKILELPKSMYANLFTTFWGFPARDFFSTDYFSLLPWYFLFLTGYFLYHFLLEKNMLQKMPDIHIPPLEWIGRNSLLIYLLHQPLVYGILMLVM